MIKILNVIFVSLLLSVSTKAANVSDYQVAGFSIGDSALDFYTKKELADNYESWNEPKYGTSEIEFNKDGFDDIQLMYKLKDPKFIIEGISALQYMDGKECLNVLESEAAAIEKQFTPKDVKFYRKKTFKHNADKSGKSKVTSIKIKFKSDKGVLIIGCYDWSTSYAAKMGYNDNLRFSIRTKSYASFLNNR